MELVQPMDCDTLATPTSPSAVLETVKFLWYRRPEVLGPTLKIEKEARKISSEFCVSVLEPLLAKLWNPHLNNLPSVSLEDSIRHFCECQKLF